MRKRLLLHSAAGFLVVLPLIMHSLDLVSLRAMEELEQRLYDVRLRATAPQGMDPRVVIVDIDEKSLKALGQWPWKRDQLAQIVEHLFEDYDVGILGFDSVFAEPDSDSTLETIRSLSAEHDLSGIPGLAELSARPDRDQVFSRVLSRYPVVMGYTFGRDPGQHSVGELPAPWFDRDTALAEKTRAPEALRYTANTPVLQGTRPGGFFSLLGGVDTDGIIRRVPLLNRFEGALYPTLSLATASAWLGVEASPIVVAGAGESYAALEGLDLGFHQISLDQQAAVYIPYRATPGPFRRISAIDVYRGEVESPEDLAGVVALLGTSAAGLVDNRATPIHPVVPGVEIHASMVAGLMDGSFRSHPGWAKGLERLLMGITVLLLVLLLPRLGAVAMSVVVLGVFAFHIVFNLTLWSHYAFIIALAPVLVATGGIYLVNLILGYFGETRSRMLLKRSFGLYVPPQIIDRMQGQSVTSLLRSERREMTVLFTDIRGFTSISESMAPEDLSELMNSFLTPMTGIVHRHGGAIDKYMGDAMMAFWGAPIEDEQHASHAVHAALEMIESLESVNAEFTSRGWPRIRIGIGLNTGTMSVGNMGSAFRMAYTVLGDAVNLGSRLEGLTSQYGVSILMNETTARLCDDIELLALDRVRVKGKLEPVRIVTPLGYRGAVPASRLDRAERFRLALHHFHARRWEDALSVFKALESECLAEDPEDAHSDASLFCVYRARSEQMLADPPGPDWDGVVDFVVK